MFHSLPRCRALRSPADLCTLALQSILLMQKLTFSIRNTLGRAALRNMMQIERQFIRYCSLKDVSRSDALAQLYAYVFPDVHGLQLSNGKMSTINSIIAVDSLMASPRQIIFTDESMHPAWHMCLYENLNECLDAHRPCQDGLLFEKNGQAGWDWISKKDLRIIPLYIYVQPDLGW